jgi:hypothetical protein
MSSGRTIKPLQNSKEESISLDLKLLSSHVLRTEHFANEGDFVAKLGVLSKNKPRNSGYANDCVFINRQPGWVGHLFGTQYSLHPAHYTDGNGQNTGGKSWLLACANGAPMRSG